jgi:hypothetical protein
MLGNAIGGKALLCRSAKREAERGNEKKRWCLQVVDIPIQCSTSLFRIHWILFP